MPSFGLRLLLAGCHNHERRRVPYKGRHARVAATVWWHAHSQSDKHSTNAHGPLARRTIQWDKIGKPHPSGCGLMFQRRVRVGLAAVCRSIAVSIEI